MLRLVSTVVLATGLATLAGVALAEERAPRAGAPAVSADATDDPAPLRRPRDAVAATRMMGADAALAARPMPAPRPKVGGATTPASCPVAGVGCGPVALAE